MELFKFDFLVVVDGAVKAEVAKIGATENEVSDLQTVKCEMATEDMKIARGPKVIQATK